MTKTRKSRTFNPTYQSPAQGILPGFEHPFERTLDLTNRWVVLAHLIPWDELCNVFLHEEEKKNAGRSSLNPRIVLGSLIIKHMCNLDDRETVDMISENIYMQYFLGYPSFVNDKPFDASLFVSIRKRYGLEFINSINEKIVKLKTHFEEQNQLPSKKSSQEESYETTATEAKSDSDDVKKDGDANEQTLDPLTAEVEHKGRVLFDATACPQDIAFPTDLDLLSDAREKSELLIDILYDKQLHKTKPRTDRTQARKDYLHTAQKKKKTKKQIRSAIRKQLGYLRHNIHSIQFLLDAYSVSPLNEREKEYFETIQKLYEQQQTMFSTKTHTIADRIVSIHQPHVRPIVRGKASAPVEFGAKIHLSLIDGICFLDELSWDAFNEGSRMEKYVEKYKQRFGFYPCEVLADKIYCTRENRKMLKDKGIILKAKPLGRPSLASAVSNHVSPGERNPIEGKFGQGKTAYGLNRIKARLKDTSESWIASIILVLNLVKLAGAIAPCSILKTCRYFSARLQKLAYRHNVFPFLLLFGSTLSLTRIQANQNELSKF